MSDEHAQGDAGEHDEQEERDEQEEQDEERKEEEEVEQRTAPHARVVYHAILAEGEEELERAPSALFWSGLAAGLSLGFSLAGEAFLHHALPDTSWRPLLAKLGYTFGFVIVILGRQQLFTENTLTPVLSLLREKSGRVLRRLLRLWAVVLVANLLGVFLFALVAAKTRAFQPGTLESVTEIATRAFNKDAGTIFVRAVFAGWLIALMVWLLPYAETARVWVVILITYLVGLGEFDHVIVGSAEAAYLALTGPVGWGEVVTHYVLPTLVGNVLGGVALVASLNHAQVVSGEEQP